MLEKIFRGRTLPYATAIILLGLMMLPVYWTTVTAFKPDEETYVFPPVYLPRNPTIEPFRLLFEDYPFSSYLKNSIVVTLTTTFIVTAIGVLAGYGLSQFKFKWAGTLLWVLVFTRIIPPLSLLLPFRKAVGVLIRVTREPCA